MLPYAPDSSYGCPEDLMSLVDAAHQRGLSVFVDVVYNHFGPDGNDLPTYAPLFTEHHKTPWGNGVNHDCDGSTAVREFIIQNAIYWIKEFRLDGLRLEAVHAIKDDSEEHLLHELARRVREAAGSRHVLMSDLEGVVFYTNLVDGANVVPADMQADLVRVIGQMPLKPFDFHGYKGTGRVVSFGWKFVFDA